MKRTPLRRVSKRRADKMVEYSNLRKQLLLERPICEVCGEAKSTDCHHKNGRNGGNYLDYSTFLSVCRRCHNLIENNKRWARDNGYLGKK